MPIPTPLQRVMTLHRYFITADLARQMHDKHLHENPGMDFESSQFLDYFALAGWWYSALWVTLDGWDQLGIPDDEIDAAKSHALYRKLKNFRDATMHYRPDYFDWKLRGFVADPDSVAWIRATHDLMGEALLRELGPFGQFTSSLRDDA